jgi:lipase chaperone LimK
VSALAKLLASVATAAALVVLAVWTARDEFRGRPPVLAEAPPDELGEGGAGSPAGFEVEGDLRTDVEGRFIASPDALRLFDSFLSAYGEAGEEVILGRIEAEIARRLPPGAAGDARALLAQHVRYRDAVRELEAGGAGTTADELAAHLERLRALRREVFGAARAEALFADDERVAEVAIERRRVLDDPSLSPRDRITRLAELQARLPEAARDAEQRALETVPLHSDPAPGGTGDWDRRLEVYRAERDRVLANVREAPPERKAHFLKQVRERHFRADELARVEALDRFEMRDRVGDAAPPPPLE